jgi:hypothetical protein
MDALRRIGRLFDREARRKERRRRKSGVAYHVDIVDEALPVFGVSSANYWRHPELTYQSANRFPSLLLDLLTRLDLIDAADRVTDIDDFVAGMGGAAEAGRLGELFAAHGSDKARHGYHPVYAAILNRLGGTRGLAILEIGLGTNDPHLVSSMGSGGTPGASLRAFRDFLPASAIYGTDVDPNILFEEERIRTAYVDQTSPAAFDQLAESLGTDTFDLIVDDGLHSVEANMNTLLFALSKLRPGGWVVIEDIPERTVVVWRSIVGLLNRAHFKARLVKAEMAHMVVAERL